MIRRLAESLPAFSLEPEQKVEPIEDRLADAFGAGEAAGRAAAQAEAQAAIDAAKAELMAEREATSAKLRELGDGLAASIVSGLEDLRLALSQALADALVAMAVERKAGDLAEAFASRVIEAAIGGNEGCIELEGPGELVEPVRRALLAHGLRCVASDGDPGVLCARLGNLLVRARLDETRRTMEAFLG